jgi:hypothetical protein
VDDLAVSDLAASEAMISVGETDELEIAPVSNVPDWDAIPVAVDETDEHEIAPVSDTPETDQYDAVPLSDTPEMDEVLAATQEPDAHETAPAESFPAETQGVSEAVIDAQAADDLPTTIVRSRSSGEAYESLAPHHTPHNTQNGPNSTPHEATTPRASTTLVIERPIDTAQPDLAKPQGAPPVSTDAPAQTAPGRREQTVRNGKASNHLPDPADLSATTLPKKARQPRAKRKRSS